MPAKFFADPHDILLICMTNGFQVFCCGKYTAWPLLFINANLPPTEHYKWQNSIFAGLISSPHKPKDFDSYMVIVTEEMVKLIQGVSSYNVEDDEMFIL
ncbi:hypothetical protein FRB99_004502, partial [Tulasnella sp. 403]